MKFWTIRNKGTATHFMANSAQRVNHSFHATEMILLCEDIYMDIQAVISIFLSCLIPIWEGFFVESEVLKESGQFWFAICSLCHNILSLKKITILLQYYIAENRAMVKVLRAKFVISCCVFANFKGILAFSVPSTILADLLGNTCLLQRVQKVMVCD